MIYRNIDEDINLYKAAKRYWGEEITKNQLFWIMKEKGYSEKEISKAIDDYYLIYIRTDKIINFFYYFILIILLFFIIFVSFKLILSKLIFQV